jgi:hypothetical protein
LVRTVEAQDVGSTRSVLAVRIVALLGDQSSIYLLDLFERCIAREEHQFLSDQYIVGGG